MRVFGRENENHALREFLFTPGSTGPGVALISGEAGMGKSVLVRHCESDVIDCGGLFLEVTCNPVNSSEADFSAAIELAVESVGENLKVEKWRRALEPFHDIVAHRLNKLAEILGFDKSSVMDRIASEQSMRFRQTASRLIHLLQDLANPIVLFLDDIQWADPESFELQRFLAQDRELSHLRILLAARPRECRPAQWSELQNSAGLHLALKGLSGRVIQEVVEAKLESSGSGERARQLVELSEGNPLYVMTALLLISSGQDDLSHLDREQLLVQAIKLLSPESLELLSQAACIGKSFSPQLLSSLSSIPESELRLRLASYLDRGFLLRKASLFEFRHDKLRDAVKELTSPDVWARTHLSLGNLLTAKPETFIQGVEYYGQGVALMTQEEKERFATRALEAARAARRAGTANRAFLLCRQGARALGAWSDQSNSDLAEAWERYENLACELCLEAAEATEGSTEEELWREPVSLLARYAKNPEIRARTALGHARALLRKAEHHKAIEVCESGLMGCPNYRPLPRKDLASAVRVARLIRALRRLAATGFQGLPVAEDPLVRLKHELMTVQAHSALHALFGQVPFYAIRECESFLAEGESPEGAHALLGFSIAVGWRLRQQALARQVAEHCLRLVGDSNTGGALQTMILREVAIEGRTRTTTDLIRSLEDLHQKCLSAGNFELATATLAIGCFQTYFSGMSLQALESSLDRLRVFQAQHRAQTADYILDVLSWAISFSSGEVREPPARTGGIHEFLGQTIELQTFLINREYVRAVELALREPSDELPIQGHLELYFWLLAGLACYWGVRSRKVTRTRARRLFVRSRKVVERWCSERKDRTWMLDSIDGVKALCLQRGGGVDELRSAMTTARNHAMIHIAALIADILAAHSREEDSRRYQNLARELYSAWKGNPDGAKSESSDEKLIRAIEELAPCSTIQTLNAKLLELLQQHSKAEKVLLFSCRTRPYRILATRNSNTVETTYLDPKDPGTFPFSILDSALTGKRALSFHAEELLSFQSDPYIQSDRQPNSLMILPVTFQARVDEVLYLESNGKLDSSAGMQSLLSLIGLQWKLLSLQLERTEQLERQRDVLDRVRQTRHQEALQTVALEARRTALATFLGVASHDLKAPLSAIAMWASQLPEGPGKDNIQAACSRATGLIHDYLDGMALELSNKIRLEKEKCDLADLVEQEIDLQLDSLEPSLRSGTRLRWELDSVEVKADPIRLRQVIANLLGNALKHCPPGTPISVVTTIDSDEAVFKVEDEGPGIPADKQARLFDAFETSSHRNGSGLGLWIVKKVTEAHRGRVGYKPKEPGSSFWVRLPLNPR